MKRLIKLIQEWIIKDYIQIYMNWLRNQKWSVKILFLIFVNLPILFGVPIYLIYKVGFWFIPIYLWTLLMVKYFEC
jgi:hypothetical protein